MKVTTSKWELVNDKVVDIPIPTKPFYCFQTGVRRSVRIIPQWTTWQVKRDGNPEEIWKLQVTCVYGLFENKVEKFELRINEKNLSDYLMEIKGVRRDQKQINIIKMLINEDYNLRTKEQFDADLDNVITQFKNDIN